MTSTDSAVQALRAALPGGQLHARGSEEYEKLNGGYLSGLESDLRPLLIFQPSSVGEVAAFVLTIRPFAGQLDCAICGAGQQPLPGCANVDGGITLDLSLLNSIALTEDKSVVQIGAGARWGAVYERLDALGLSVTGSRSAAGGVGGLALAGGLSFFSSREGFICDNVVNYQVVLSSGKVVNANEHENADLWVALRGGGNNFGIVTRFDLRTFEQGPFWGGNVFYFADNFPNQIESLVSELTKPNASDLTHIMISIAHSVAMAAAFGAPILCLNQAYYAEAVENPPVLDPFTKVTPQIDALNSMSLKNVTAAASEQAEAAQSQVRAAYINMAVKADVAALQAISDIYTAALSPLYNVSGATFALTLQPYPVSLLAKSDASGGNKTDDAAVIAFMEGSLEKMRADEKARDALVPYIYMNYAFTGQDVIGSYGPGNKAKLQAASEKYDTVRLFQTGFRGGFKLFD
ncbi:hypothetical protein C8A01DRAFT_34772 [Parachaetomium inaequale]|uniref:FAD-binding PCMH-type domain-containing protein n=1 Tax=Parachaetomium inaequale TaxID=2588326 RepID=A0AAN6PME8_9PEZI|nr:hypothetical protein C8A01DRAFT_34772 [Parachaetomium inaequale]